MPEENEQTTSPPQPKEMCTLRIMFPVVSDEQALDIKKKVSAIVNEIPDAQIHFAIMPMPTGLPSYRGT